MTLSPAGVVASLVARGPHVEGGYRWANLEGGSAPLLPPAWRWVSLSPDEHDIMVTMAESAGTTSFASSRRYRSLVAMAPQLG